MTDRMTMELEPTTPTVAPEILERVLLHGDLSKLTAQQKLAYLKAVCESLGLNPLTKPFQYIVLSGKEVLYATRDATDQLRKRYSVSVTIPAREMIEDCYVVTATATMPTGRHDTSTGVVAIGSLKGEFRANAMMKAETKAKRRVTLAICGLGMLDETEVDAGAERVDLTTGEVTTQKAITEKSQPKPAMDPETRANLDANSITLPPRPLTEQDAASLATGQYLVVGVEPQFAPMVALIRLMNNKGEERAYPTKSTGAEAEAREACRKIHAVTMTVEVPPNSVVKQITELKREEPPL